jgi:aspartyl-tRNA(Asn)/glutamyl-tRNA(Gln) amidotransferase subunit C
MSETQKQTQPVAADDVKRVAELAYLELTADEEVRMQRDLNAILNYVAQLNELDTSSVEPMAQVAEVLGNASSALRADVQVPSLPRERVMISAPDTDGTFFKVPKVIER